MARKYSEGRNRPSWARFYNDWKNPSSYWGRGQRDPIEDEEKPLNRAKAVKKKSPVIRTVIRILKPNRIDNGQE